ALHAGGQRFDPAWLHHPLPLGSATVSKLRNEYSLRILISELFQNRSLKIWVCDRKIDWITLSLVFIQAKVKFVSDS
ncbi:MAG: hypothetical protein RSE62_22155, partial [Citrobacter sp.]